MITSEKLNKIENGIEGASGGSGLFIVHATESLDDSEWGITVTEDTDDIFQAIQDGRQVVMYILSAIYTETYMIAHLCDYTLPRDGYSGFLDFRTTPDISAPTDVQYDMEQKNAMWDEEWSYTNYVVIIQKPS